jgi:hypothetical protein
MEKAKGPMLVAALGIATGRAVPTGLPTAALMGMAQPGPSGHPWTENQEWRNKAHRGSTGPGRSEPKLSARQSFAERLQDARGAGRRVISRKMAGFLKPQRAQSEQTIPVYSRTAPQHASKSACSLLF